MGETFECPCPEHGKAACGRCSGCCGAEEYCCTTPEVAAEAWKRDAEDAGRERDDAREEVERCRALLKDAHAIIKREIKPPTLAALLACIEERDAARAEVVRLNGVRLDLAADSQDLRAALAVYAERERWASGSYPTPALIYWLGDAEPWRIAQEALAGGADIPAPSPSAPESHCDAPESGDGE